MARNPVPATTGRQPVSPVQARVAQIAKAVRSRAVARLIESEPAALLLAAICSEMVLGRQNPSRSVLVTSSRRGEGRSTLALTIAALAAASDIRLKVLLVDADGGGCTRMAGLPAVGAGLSDLLYGAVRLEQCATPAILDNLHVLTPGHAAEFALFQGLGTFESLAQDGWGGYDFVVVDAGPVCEKSVLVLARPLKLAVFAVQASGPTISDLEEALAELKRAGATVLGSVLTQRPVRLRRAFWPPSQTET